MFALVIIAFFVSTALLMALGAALSIATDPHTDGAEWAGALFGVVTSVFVWFAFIFPALPNL